MRCGKDEIHVKLERGHHVEGSSERSESYRNEELILELLPGLLEQNGFSGVTTSKHGAMKFVDATTADETAVRFWMKQGWTGPEIRSHPVRNARDGT